MIVTLAALALASGLLMRQEPLALSGLTMLVWIALEWLNFRLRTAGVSHEFTPCRRRVNGQTRASHILVIEQEAQVEVEVFLSSRLRGLRCRFEDAVPQEIPWIDGSPAHVTDVQSAGYVVWRYVLRPAITTRTSLPGVQVTLSDSQGLFRLHWFAPLYQDVTVLPFLVRPQPTVSVLKQQNVQMLPGTHRHRRAGYSTELLGIREYQPGDPPRSIAWKATARLGRLMTCEYESEAPIRATLLADLSPAWYIGRPGPAPADKIIAASSSLARLLLSDGDPVASLIVSQTEPMWTPHGLGERHLTRLLLRWLSFSRPLSVEGVNLNILIPLAWTCGARRFPELFDEAINPPKLSAFTRRRCRKSVAQRQQLASALSTLYGGGPGVALRLQFDDSLFRERCRRLLEEHPGMVDLTVLPRQQAALTEEARNAAHSMHRGLLARVAHANDNELFIVIGAVPEHPADRESLLDVVRVARAEHHRVMFVEICAASSVEAQAASETVAFADFQRELVRLGAKFSRLDDPRLMQKAAAEIELLRLGRTRGAGAGR